MQGSCRLSSLAPPRIRNKRLEQYLSHSSFMWSGSDTWFSMPSVIILLKGHFGFRLAGGALRAFIARSVAVAADTAGHRWGRHFHGTASRRTGARRASQNGAADRSWGRWVRERLACGEILSARRAGKVTIAIHGQSIMTMWAQDLPAPCDLSFQDSKVTHAIRAVVLPITLDLDRLPAMRTPAFP